ncbi:MAG: Fic family protein [Candidatus Babeliales bacterium]|jgi:Fic family protein
MFKPNFTITPQLVQLLMRIGQLKAEIQNLPITPTVLASLRQSARLQTTHYSTMIEGNRLTMDQVENLIGLGVTFPGRQRDQKEVLGYYAALEKIKSLTSKSKPLTENDIKLVHAIVMHGGTTTVKPTAYRDGQNAIYDGHTKNLVYLPPEAHDVPTLMSELVAWINQSEKDNVPSPLIAALSHYQFATVHPYYDGNGRTARLLATIILHRGGYDLKGLYSLEEYYAKNLPAYYEALSAGPSHNYYFGREEADITPWINYFCHGMVDSFEKVTTHALIAYHKGDQDKTRAISNLDAQQQAILALFQKKNAITSKDIALFFAVAPRTARDICLKWVKNKFLVLKDAAKKSRKYTLHSDVRKNLFD